MWMGGRAGKNVIYLRYGRVQWQFFLIQWITLGSVTGRRFPYWLSICKHFKLCIMLLVMYYVMLPGIICKYLGYLSKVTRLQAGWCSVKFPAETKRVLFLLKNVQTGFEAPQVPIQSVLAAYIIVNKWQIWADLSKNEWNWTWPCFFNVPSWYPGQWLYLFQAWFYNLS
jgi:hypothetical protein